MTDQYERTRIIIGSDGLKKLKTSSVIIFGIGGVGGAAAEALSRAGIGKITLVDNDVVDITNINRQIIALHETIGKSKVSVMAERINCIDPSIEVICEKRFFLPENSDSFDLDDAYIIDAVDTVAAKIELANIAYRRGLKIISAMGTGNKVHPEMLEIADIYDTSVCPLARVMRRELKTRGVKHLECVYSKEIPAVKSVPPGSVSFVPPVAGYIMAGEIIREILNGQ